MKCILLVVFALSAVSARPQSTVVDNYKEISANGYKFGWVESLGHCTNPRSPPVNSEQIFIKINYNRFETTDPQQRQEEGSPKTVDGQEIISVKGKYNFETPDGTQYEVQYIADELGYRTKTVVLNRPGQGGSGASAVNFGNGNGAGSGNGNGNGDNGAGSFVGNGPAGVVSGAIDSGVAATNDGGSVFGLGGDNSGYNYGDNGYGSDGGVNSGYDANAYNGVGNGGADVGFGGAGNGGFGGANSGLAGRTGYEYNSPGANALVY